MGFYLGMDRMPPGAIEGTITAGEYCQVMDDVLRTLRDRPELAQVRYQVPLCYLRIGRFPAAVGFLADVVSRRPDDQVAHRLLAIAHLSQGNPRAAVAHLEAARRLLQKERAVSETLRDCVRVQHEEALMRYLLVPLYLQLGRMEDARALVTEGQGL